MTQHDPNKKVLKHSQAVGTKIMPNIINSPETATGLWMTEDSRLAQQLVKAGRSGINGLGRKALNIILPQRKESNPGIRTCELKPQLC